MPEVTSYDKLKRTESSKILLVEGVDDGHCLMHLFHLLGLEENFQIAVCGNREKVLAALNTETVAVIPAAVVGAVFDMDNSNMESIRQSVQRVIGKNYALPDTPPADHIPGDGLILMPATNTAGLPRLGVWCMPDNRTEGIFEDLLNRAIPDLAKQFIQQTLTTALKRKHASFTEIQRPKATLRTYMAWQDPTWSKYGEALGAGLLNADALLRHFQPFINWANRLFGAQPAQDASPSA